MGIVLVNLEGRHTQAYTLTSFPITKVHLLNLISYDSLHPTLHVIILVMAGRGTMDMVYAPLAPQVTPLLVSVSAINLPSSLREDERAPCNTRASFRWKECLSLHWGLTWYLGIMHSLFRVFEMILCLLRTLQPQALGFLNCSSQGVSYLGLNIKLLCGVEYHYLVEYVSFIVILVKI